MDGRCAGNLKDVLGFRLYFNALDPVVYLDFDRDEEFTDRRSRQRRSFGSGAPEA
ncbi:MAG: hypothetical protein IPJ30_12825 [Acidobacteria bacterium]|nr:hypothetical protein [Acidobacteriota bacterium]